MIKRIRYWLWKRRIQKEVVAGRTATCYMCDDPIVPGDFIGVGFIDDADERRQVLVHAGFHFSLSEVDAFCETGAIGCAIWDGNQVAYVAESLASKTLRTGQVQVM